MGEPRKVKVKSVRTAFVEAFDEATALQIEAAANEHSNGVNSERKGDDPFKWALLICIGYQCMEKDGFRKHHDIKPAWAKLKKWIKDNARLDLHNSDCDYLALIGGAYNEFMPKKAATNPREQP